jgi:putative endonuclease
MKFRVYILRSKLTGKFYTGQTNDLADRILRHNSGSESYTSSGVPWELVWSEMVESRSLAVALERKIKKRGAN